MTAREFVTETWNRTTSCSCDRNGAPSVTKSLQRCLAVHLLQMISDHQNIDVSIIRFLTVWPSLTCLEVQVLEVPVRHIPSMDSLSAPTEPGAGGDECAGHPGTDSDWKRRQRCFPKFLAPNKQHIFSTMLFLLRLKLADFGLACSFTPGEVLSSKVGTVLYCSPQVGDCFCVNFGGFGLSYSARSWAESTTAPLIFGAVGWSCMSGSLTAWVLDWSWWTGG